MLFINNHILRHPAYHFRDIAVLFPVCGCLGKFEILFILFGTAVHTPWIGFRPFPDHGDVLLFDGEDRVHHFRVVGGIAFPFIVVLDVDCLALDVATMNGAFVDIRLLEVVYQDVRHSFHIAVPFHIFHVGHVELDRIDEILHIHRVFTFLVQEQVHVEGVVGVVAVIDCIMVSC